MGDKEGDLTRESTMTSIEFMRVVTGGSNSRLITVANYVTNVLNDLLVAAGFIKTAGTQNYHIVAPNVTIDTALVVATHEIVLGNCTAAAVTLTLPNASTAWDAATSSGYAFTIKKNDASSGNDLTVAAQVGETIDGSSSVVLSGTNKPNMQVIASSLTTWVIIGG